MTVAEIMERAGIVSMPNQVIESIKKCIETEFVRNSILTGTAMKKIDIQEGRVLYKLPTGLSSVESVQVLFLSEETEMITDSASRNPSGADIGDWDNDPGDDGFVTFGPSIDYSGGLSLSYTGGVRSAYLAQGSYIFETGNLYRFKYTAAVSSMDTNSLYFLFVPIGEREGFQFTIGYVKAGTDNSFEFEAPCNGQLHLISVKDLEGELILRNMSIVEIGQSRYGNATELKHPPVFDRKDRETNNVRS